MIKKYILVTAIFIADLLFFTSTSYAKEDNDEKLVSRSVLIIDFYNSNKSDQFEYLENSIPDAVYEKLYSTTKFELLKRNIWVNAIKLKEYSKSDANNEDVAIALGKKNDAEIVVMGSFSINGEYIQMIGKAIEVSSGRMIVTQKEVSKTTSNIFNSIDNLAENMAIEMKKKLPPLPPKEITDKTNLKDQNIENKKIAFYVDPFRTIFTIYNIRLDVGISHWMNLSLYGSYFDLTPWESVTGINAKGYYLGVGYRLMLISFNKPGRTSLNGLYIAPVFQYSNAEVSDGGSFTSVELYSMGVEFGHQWVYANGFTFGIRAGYLYSIQDPAGTIPNDYLAYMVPFNAAGPVLTIDFGYAY